MEKKYIYVMVCDTHSMITQGIHLFVKNDTYFHSSISLDIGLKQMYSYGRKIPLFPIPGGFVHEAVNAGTFKHFRNTRALIMQVEVSQEGYQRAVDLIRRMEENREDYGYNYAGLLLASMGMVVSKKNRFYCSEFVREVLTVAGVLQEGEMDGIVRPMQFYERFCDNTVYDGLLRDYCVPQE